jgi:hypothetical protein
MTDIKPSEEQQKIIDLLSQKHNVCVNSVAGSGKSTSVLSVATAFPQSRILQLTYNSSLRLEMVEKVERAHINNIEIHTYHSFCVKYYNPNGHTDLEMRKIVLHGSPPQRNIPLYDILVVDEAQDQTALYYRFVRKLVADMCAAAPAHKFQLLILGDDKQNLYGFKGADHRYLTMADKLWHDCPHLLGAPNPPQFVFTTLRTSYRITRPMAEFVNNFMLGEERMLAPRDGPHVMYIHNTQKNIENKVIYEITNLIERGGAKPSDFFILSGSVKGRMSNVRLIENALVERGIPCNVPMFDTEAMDDRVIQGKVVFSTFHCVKGRQRPYVFVVGFSQSYMDIMCRGEPHDVCPNTLYVACTRASERLYLLEEDRGFEDKQLRFLKYDHLEMHKCDYVEFKGLPKPRLPDEYYEDPAAAMDDSPAAAEVEERKIYSKPTELIRFISEDVFDKIMPIMDTIFEVVKEKLENPVQIPVIQQMAGGNYEEISDINGIAIPCMYYDRVLMKMAGERTGAGESSIYEILQTEIAAIKKNKRGGGGRFITSIEEKIKHISKKCSHTRDYLYLSNMYIALKEHLYFKLSQISAADYDWLPPHIIRQSFKIMRGALEGEDCADFSAEETIISYGDDYTKMDAILSAAGVRLFRLNARVDLITNNTVWEIKCTTNTNIEHLLQVVIYAWIWRVALERPAREFKIMNIKTGEILRLNATDEELTAVVLEIFKNKYTRQVAKTDAEFLAEAAAAVAAK